MWACTVLIKFFALKKIWNRSYNLSVRSVPPKGSNVQHVGKKYLFRTKCLVVGSSKTSFIFPLFSFCNRNKGQRTACSCENSCRKREVGSAACIIHKVLVGGGTEKGRICVRNFRWQTICLSLSTLDLQQTFPAPLSLTPTHSYIHPQLSPLDINGLSAARFIRRDKVIGRGKTLQIPRSSVVAIQNIPPSDSRRTDNHSPFASSVRLLHTPHSPS